MEAALREPRGPPGESSSLGTRKRMSSRLFAREGGFWPGTVKDPAAKLRSLSLPALRRGRGAGEGAVATAAPLSPPIVARVAQRGVTQARLRPIGGNSVSRQGRLVLRNPEIPAKSA